jgi:glycosyltransferase involved in cell wall biosynthesis
MNKLNTKVFFLFDAPLNDWLKDGFEGHESEISLIGMRDVINKYYRFRIQRIVVLHYYYIMQTLSVIIRSKKGDVIVCWLDVTAMYMLFFSVIFCSSRKIISINIMFNPGVDVISFIKKVLFAWMLNHKNVYPTVTSKELVNTYSNTFKLCNKHFFLLHDCYGNDIDFKNIETKNENYVFCGGSNGRDWLTILKVAEQLPEISFVVVVPNKKILGEHCPVNIIIHENISRNDFKILMANSSLIALPLNTQAPAGLIVMLCAGLLSKAVVTTDNITMREYITTGLNGILVGMNQSSDFAKQVKELYFDRDKQFEYGRNLSIRIEEIASPRTYITEIINIVNEVRSF